MNTASSLTALVQEAADRLQAAHDRGELSFGHGTTNAHDEAAWLVLWSLGLPLDTDVALWDFNTQHADRPADTATEAGVDADADTQAQPATTQPLTAERTEQALALVQERITSRRPAAYLTNEAWLQGVPFYIDERAIVPRSLIAEVLADGSIDAWLGADTRQVLDLCTGNGSLAVLCALAWPEVSVLGLDLSPDALAVARINVNRHWLSERIQLGMSDGLRDAPGAFDLIVCNPPYVNAQSMAALPAEYRAEPELALAGGSDGMDFVRTLLRDAPAHLTPHGVLVLEIGNEHAHFKAAFPDLDVVWLPTSAGDDQVLLVTRDALLAARSEEQPTVTPDARLPNRPR